MCVIDGVVRFQGGGGGVIYGNGHLDCIFAIAFLNQFRFCENKDFLTSASLFSFS